ncbi:glutamine-hydrolyzing carbamoyl-phosphate synthase small subunit [Euzebya tangerina]|uniref:glutamine-hydrolyzing carbamoyl-phosphate synthase small subunit n=1 Tax=Euzebya tangerina TaxID=591198 RepID=UPI000E323DA4|nr:glutamine-hydrolyzing carbamoyl-phosphate synthase small subunit [Euzebya tangerina]
MTTTAATLVLEDGTTFRGESFGAVGTTTGEVVFNTAMTGYQEVLTDPSYHRQIVTMTYPHMGNYGVTPADDESGRVQVAGFIAREASRVYSSHRAEISLDERLASAGVVGIAEIDTRRLVRHIRQAGAMRGVISTEIGDTDELQRRAAAADSMEGAELASEVSTPEPYDSPAVGEQRFRVVAYDFGLKRNITRLLNAAGCHVTVVPATTSAQDVLAHEPDGVFLSNGPGDPAAVRAGIAAIAEILPTETPVFGICLGHQLLAKAAGAQTYKLKFGHRGANHPVRNDAKTLLASDPTLTGLEAFVRAAQSIEITSQNHGFSVDADSLPTDGPMGRVVQTHVNLSDWTNEGIALTDLPAFSVQYHPEAAPGPHDARYLFGQFTQLMADRSPNRPSSTAAGN